MSVDEEETHDLLVSGDGTRAVAVQEEQEEGLPSRRQRKNGRSSINNKTEIERPKTFIWITINSSVAAIILFLMSSLHPTSNTTKTILNYQCPTGDDEDLSTFNYDIEMFQEDYLANDAEPIYHNKTYFLQNFRDHKFDGWSRTYREFKKTIYEFKKLYYVPNLKNGDSIYESACGVGLNLYATLEVLQEEANITDLTIYGNEYLKANVIKAQTIVDTLLESQDVYPKNKKGSICHADSMNLSHIPSSSFDLVFTGYISPLWDPLELGKGFDDNYEMMKSLCIDAKEAATKTKTKTKTKTWRHHDNDDTIENWHSIKLLEIMQKNQEDWYGHWVKEMIRIAKPGAPVIIEEIGYPLCQNMYDWGGVEKSFWSSSSPSLQAGDAIQRYQWDINPSSIEFWDRKATRYAVFMRKKE